MVIFFYLTGKEIDLNIAMRFAERKMAGVQKRQIIKT